MRESSTVDINSARLKTVCFKHYVILQTRICLDSLHGARKHLDHLHDKADASYRHPSVWCRHQLWYRGRITRKWMSISGISSWLMNTGNRVGIKKWTVKYHLFRTLRFTLLDDDFIFFTKMCHLKCFIANINVTFSFQIFIQLLTTTARAELCPSKCWITAPSWGSLRRQGRNNTFFFSLSLNPESLGDLNVLGFIIIYIGRSYSKNPKREDKIFPPKQRTCPGTRGLIVDLIIQSFWVFAAFSKLYLRVLILSGSSALYDHRWVLSSFSLVPPQSLQSTQEGISSSFIIILHAKFCP